ncbi:MAG: hypothetical protein R3B54_07370 [Bdellovibrionota bacterium]
MPNRAAWRAQAEHLIVLTADVQGREFPAPEKGTLLVFMIPGCPLANLYSKRLSEFADVYGAHGIQVQVVLVSEARSDEDLAKWSRERKMEMKVVHDDGSFQKHFQAAISPEAFLLDNKFELVYRGLIDDQYAPGRPNFQAPTDTPVKDRLQKMVKGETIRPSFSEAKGCVLNSSPVSFNRTIAPLIYERCATCHRPGDIQSDIPLVNYAEIAAWAPTLVERINEGYMPPWRAHHGYGEFSNDVALTVNEMWAFKKWVDSGLPVEPDALEASEDLLRSVWRLGPPDKIVGMLPEGESYAVPAEGILPYQHFVIDSPFEKDTWVLATEVRPGARDVVHHINVFIKSKNTDRPLVRFLKRSGASRRLEARGQEVDGDSLNMILDLYGFKLEKQIKFLSDFNPAESVTRFPKGKGLLLRKEDQIIFEVHYTPNGYTPREDRSLLAFKVAAEVPEDWRLREPITHIGGHLGQINIEAGKKQSLFLDIPIESDADLHSLKPHMHYRGKSFRAELIIPNQPARTLLFLPQWDYDFQLPYLFKDPIFMPKGSTLRLNYEWDNSKDNPFLNDGQIQQPARFGFQTDDEMSMAFPTYTYRTQDAREIEAAELQVRAAILRQVKLPSLADAEE